MLNKPRPDIPDNFVACLIDVSQYYLDSEEGRALLERCGGKIYESGFFNDAVNTHICSLTPSVYVEVLELVPERYPDEEPARNDLWEELNNLHTIDDSGYYDRSDIERLRTEHPDRFKVLGDVEGETDKAKHEAVREELQGNPVF